MDPATITLIILAVTVVLALTEYIPLACTAVLCCTTLALTGVLSSSAAFASFASTNIMMYIATFIIGAALFRTGVAKRIGNVISRFSKTEKLLVWAIAIVATFLSAFLSNLGTTAMMLPIILGIAQDSNLSRGKLVYIMGIAAGGGGMATVMGAPGNMATKAYIENATGQVWGAFEMSRVGIPLALIMIVYLALVAYKLVPDRTTGTAASEASRKETPANGEPVPAWHANVTILVFIMVIIGMVFEEQIGIPLFLTAVIGALILVMLRILPEAEAYKAINWKVVVIFGGLLPLGTAIKDSGAGDILGGFILQMIGDTRTPYIITAVLMLVPMIMTQFMSNNTTKNLMMPVAVAVATAMKADPVAVILAVNFGASFALLTPMSAPQNMLIFGEGNFKMSDFVKCGLPLTMILYAVAVFMIPTFWPFF